MISSIETGVQFYCFQWNTNLAENNTRTILTLSFWCISFIGIALSMIFCCFSLIKLNARRIHRCIVDGRLNGMKKFFIVQRMRTTKNGRETSIDAVIGFFVLLRNVRCAQVEWNQRTKKKIFFVFSALFFPFVSHLHSLQLPLSLSSQTTKRAEQEAKLLTKLKCLFFIEQLEDYPNFSHDKNKIFSKMRILLKIYRMNGLLFITYASPNVSSKSIRIIFIYHNEKKKKIPTKENNGNKKRNCADSLQFYFLQLICSSVKHYT